MSILDNCCTVLIIFLGLSQVFYIYNSLKDTNLIPWSNQTSTVYKAIIYNYLPYIKY